MEKCCGCSKQFVNGDVVITFYFEQVKAGDKSGALGFYEHRNSPENSVEHVHFTYGCLEKCFSPVDNPFMYDVVAEAVRRQIWEDEKEQDPDIPLHILDYDDPPFCLWCKREDTVWIQVQRDMRVYNCLACRRLWDHNEDELYWDANKNVYEYVDPPEGHFLPET